ncbi:hypothetical protein Pmani_020232 [Petrolisthes manimaculis]|uniref:Uncharacterized protein n=1 Tax=Petrolisthes manimaculis TaxID=1843537 RepID=A0AAE1U392_9EUCA|nr:hypothetical protein Pmani_020232 [Petrolisthes manimaculis]
MHDQGPGELRYIRTSFLSAYVLAVVLTLAGLGDANLALYSDPCWYARHSMHQISLDQDMLMMMVVLVEDFTLTTFPRRDTMTQQELKPTPE